jgi:uncharacterized protein YecE (DUF72 family)
MAAKFGLKAKVVLDQRFILLCRLPSMTIPGKFYGGTSGLQLPMPKRDFPSEYADNSRLHFYSTIVNSLEVNSSFYKVPLTSTVKKWSEDVCGDFKFTFKLWRGITHNKGLEFQADDVRKFMSVIDCAGNRKGCLLIQFPPSLTADNKNQLQNLLSVINNYNQSKWPIALEFRHRSWYRDDIYQLIETYKASLVIHDMPTSASPLDSFNNNFVYLRFHGPDGKYQGSYTDEFLSEYASYINDWLDEGKTVYTYFNNTMGNALQNLITLRTLVKI